ncbi:PqqD family protein [Ruminococcaceae bacterium OttesenSCG-928-D13]|nr:PqqD family protein [Ruminococcaceae bacterium OttesenSCG-928-D13]
MKIKDGYILRDIADSFVVVPVGERVIDFKGVMTLTGIAPFIWTQMEKDTSREDLLAKVLEEYEVDGAQAGQDIDSLLAKMAELGLLDT